VALLDAAIMTTDEMRMAVHTVLCDAEASARRKIP